MKHQSTLYYFFLVILISCNASSEGRKNTGGLAYPNVIILLADDLGYGDLSCYGSQSIGTPHLGSLAAQGMKFTHFYAGSAVCSPSRASLLTGKFPLRYNIRQHLTDSTDHLPEQVLILAELLKGAGYATAHIGKWHLGGLRLSDVARRQAGKPALPGPLQQGFDHYKHATSVARGTGIHGKARLFLANGSLPIFSKSRAQAFTLCHRSGTGWLMEIAGG